MVGEPHCIPEVCLGRTGKDCFLKPVMPVSGNQPCWGRIWLCLAFPQRHRAGKIHPAIPALFGATINTVRHPPGGCVVSSALRCTRKKSYFCSSAAADFWVTIVSLSLSFRRDAGGACKAPGGRLTSAGCRGSPLQPSLQEEKVPPPLQGAVPWLKNKPFANSPLFKAETGYFGRHVGQHCSSPHRPRGCPKRPL